LIKHIDRRPEKQIRSCKLQVPGANVLMQKINTHEIYETQKRNETYKLKSKTDSQIERNMDKQTDR